MTSGVVYYFCGPRFAERIAVSMFTLRKWWKGPVTLFATTTECEQIARGFCPAFKATVATGTQLAARHSAYVTKTLLPAWSPFDRTIFLDGDTVVSGVLDELLDPPVAVTQFADWQSLGSRMRGRISAWRGLSPMIDALVEKQLSESFPALNTGVFAFHRTGAWGQWAQQWHALALAGQKLNLTDELAMQLLHSEIDGLKVLDCRYNCSPVYAPNTQDVRVWHYHGDGHIRKPQGRPTWLPAFQEAMATKAGRIHRWAGRHDPWVRSFLKLQ